MSGSDGEAFGFLALLVLFLAIIALTGVENMKLVDRDDRRALLRIGVAGLLVLLITAAAASLAFGRDFLSAAHARGSIIARARDDGRYAGMDPQLKAWFDQLASGKGLCCSFADGFSVSNVDWDTQDGRYRVRLHGEWIVVPDTAVVDAPNKFGQAVVWPYMDASGATQIRCFLPGAGA